MYRYDCLQRLRNESAEWSGRKNEGKRTKNNHEVGLHHREFEKLLILSP
jgi:hypothetical protein